MTAAEKALLKSMARYITEGLEAIREDYLRIDAIRRELAQEAKTQEAKQKIADASAILLDVNLYRREKRLI
jgi:hypothetical protein